MEGLTRTREFLRSLGWSSRAWLAVSSALVVLAGAAAALAVTIEDVTQHNGLSTSDAPHLRFFVDHRGDRLVTAAKVVTQAGAAPVLALLGVVVAVGLWWRGARVIVAVAPTIALGAGAAWVTNFGSGSLSRIDLRSNRTVATVPLGPNAEGVAILGGDVWATSNLTSTLYRIDPATNRVVKKIVLGALATIATVSFSRSTRRGPAIRHVGLRLAVGRGRLAIDRPPCRPRGRARARPHPNR